MGLRDINGTGDILGTSWGNLGTQVGMGLRDISGTGDTGVWGHQVQSGDIRSLTFPIGSVPLSLVLFTSQNSVGERERITFAGT